VKSTELRQRWSTQHHCNTVDVARRRFTRACHVDGNVGVLHPGDALLHSLGVRGPDQVFEGHSESRLHVCIIFVHSLANTTTSSACT
jgi:hypothetical protein